MSKINVQGAYNCALDGMGLILKGVPENPSYLQSNAGVFQNRFAQGDRGEADFSFWWFWSETDWSKGFQNEFYTQGDSGFFKSSNNVNTFKETGKIQCLDNPASVKVIGGLGTTAVMGDSINWGSLLLFPINKSTGTATLYTLSTDGTLTNKNLPGQCGYTVYGMDVLQQYAYIACGNPTAAGTAIVRMDAGGTFSIPNGTNYSTIGSARAVCTVGKTLYLAYASGTATEGDKIDYTYDGTTFSQAINFTGQNRKVSEGNMVSYNATLYYLIQEGNKIELWQYASGIANMIYSWDYLSSAKLSTYLSYLMIVGVVNGKTIHFLFDGYRMKTSFEQMPSTTSVTYGKFFEVFGVGYCGGVCAKLSDSGDLIYYPSYNFTTNGTTIQPVASFNGYLYLSNAVDSNGSFVIQKADPIAGATYATAGTHTITSPIHTGFIPDVNKIYHDCIIRCDALQSGEVIKVDYSIDAQSLDTSATWTTLGSADYSVDGAITSKILNFPTTSPVIAKQIKRRITLTPSGTTTPKIQDVSFRYLPMTYYPYEWQVTVNASDEIELLNHQWDTKTGRQIRNNLQVSLWKNQIVDWQDIDYFSTKLTSAMTATGTIAQVLDTTNAPETGRLIIDNEEMFYTTKKPTSFDNITRGERGTQALTHGSASVVDNGYKVLLTGVKSQVPVLNNDKKLEYLTTIGFRENV